jgi:hypothetical protein
MIMTFKKTVYMIIIIHQQRFAWVRGSYASNVHAGIRSTEHEDCKTGAKKNLVETQKKPGTGRKGKTKRATLDTKSKECQQ